MIGSIRAGIGQCSLFNLDKYGQFVAQPFLYIFGLILPHKAVGLAFAEKSEKRRAFIIGQALQGVDAVY